MKNFKTLTVIAFMLSVFIYGCKQDCGIGYSGKNCDTEIRTQYYGTYNVTTSCSTAYTITISSSAQGADYVEIGNIDKIGSTVYAKFEESSQSTLVIPQQVSAGNTFQGSLSYTTNFTTANLSYTKTLSGGTILPSCTGVVSK